MNKTKSVKRIIKLRIECNTDDNSNGILVVLLIFLTIRLYCAQMFVSIHKGVSIGSRIRNLKIINIFFYFVDTIIYPKIVDPQYMPALVLANRISTNTVSNFFLILFVF